MKTIDVSSYQGIIDWKKVKAEGVGSAILKIIRKDLKPDTRFEENYKGCINANVPIQGVYNYTYATTVAKAKSDAQRVVEVLNGRKLFVWLDYEDATLPKSSLAADIINAYGDVITGAGLPFGIYFGLSYYNSYLKKFWAKIRPEYKVCWVARYPSTKEMRVSDNPMASKKPTVDGTLFGWQYTSECRVNGISGRCDMSETYVYDNKKKAMNAAKPLLKRGMITEEVRVLQQNLNTFGYGLVTDGNFGAKTGTALGDWQKRNGLVSDQIYGAASYAKMQELL